MKQNQPNLRSNLWTWARLGAALALIRHAPKAQPGSFRVAREVLAHRREAGLAFVVFLTILLSLLILWRPALRDYTATTTDSLQWIAINWFFGAVFLIVLNQIFFFRLAFSTLLRAGIFLILGITGLAAQSGVDLVDAASEARLASPDLQPLLVGKGRKPLNESHVREIQAQLEGVGIVPPAVSAAERAVFGRHAHAQVRAFIPDGAASEPAPECATELPQTARPLNFAMMSVSLDESFLRGLRWFPLEPGDTTTVATLSETDIARVGRPQPALQGSIQGGAVYVEKSIFSGPGGFNLETTAAIPHWICIDLLNVGDYAAFAVTAIIDSIPTYDLYDFRIVMHIDAGATIAVGHPSTQSSDLSYSLMSIWMVPETRRPMLDFLSRLATQNDFKMEVGFSRVWEAIEAADAARNLAIVFSFIVAILASTVTVVFVIQSINDSRRELAVSIAFGARFHQIFAFVFALLFVPFVISIGAGVIVVLFPFHLILDWMSLVFDFSSTAVPPAYVLFWRVVVVGSGLVFAAVAVTVLLWLKTLKTSSSIAQQLQEAA